MPTGTSVQNTKEDGKGVILLVLFIRLFAEIPQGTGKPGKANAKATANHRPVELRVKHNADSGTAGN